MFGICDDFVAFFFWVVEGGGEIAKAGARENIHFAPALKTITKERS